MLPLKTLASHIMKYEQQYHIDMSDIFLLRFVISFLIYIGRSCW